MSVREQRFGSDAFDATDTLGDEVAAQAERELVVASEYVELGRRWIAERGLEATLEA